MKLLIRLVVLVLLIAGWALAGAAVHVVRNPGIVPFVGMVHIVPKSNLSYRDTWVDTTKWREADLKEHRVFVRRLEEAGRTDWIKHVTRGTAFSL